MPEKIIVEQNIQDILVRTHSPSRGRVLALLKKASLKTGLELAEAGYLLNVIDPDLLQEIFKLAAKVKDEIYGERLVFFAPLYISDFCANNCAYCNFHISNQALKRKKLTLNELEEQVKFLLELGHKRLLLEAGEDSVHNNIDYVVRVINKIYSIKTSKGNIRRINVNIAATTTENYRKLKQANIGTYQLFQETYHRKTYEKLHCGPKQDYSRQITAHNNAFAAGLDDLGLGVLFGLYDWRFEVLALIAHANYLDKKFGVGPHTISVPRFRPGPTITYQPEYEVSDDDFLKLIAILRLAVPYTGMIISTREKPKIRRAAFKIGISQASAGSVASTGGYGKADTNEAQFELFDTRPLSYVLKGVLKDKLLPSFCTACYRKGRTGETFMNLSKPGDIHNFCRPNGILTFAEYLEDFCKDGIYEKGYKLIHFYLNKINNEELRKQTGERLDKVRQGERDLFF